MGRKQGQTTNIIPFFVVVWLHSHCYIFLNDAV